MGSLRRGCQYHTAERSERNRTHRSHSEGGEHRQNAQEELQGIRAPREAYREFAGAAQDFGAQAVSGDERAIGAAGGCSAAGLSAGQQLSGAELPLFDGHGMEHCLPIP